MNCPNCSVFENPSSLHEPGRFFGERHTKQDSRGIPAQFTKDQVSLREETSMGREQFGQLFA
jgi:hypothetical protein